MLWSKREVKDRTRGTARIGRGTYGEAEPSPHIGRQSRFEKLS
jgi:hypothetical protein